MPARVQKQPPPRPRPPEVFDLLAHETESHRLTSTSEVTGPNRIPRQPAEPVGAPVIVSADAKSDRLQMVVLLVLGATTAG
jgi:hypothetical protein